MKDLLSENKGSEMPECRREHRPGLIIEQHQCYSDSLGHKTQTLPVEENVTQKLNHLEICADEFPGSSATYRILEVTFCCPGSGVSEVVILGILSIFEPMKCLKCIPRYLAVMANLDHLRCWEHIASKSCRSCYTCHLEKES